MKIQRNTVQWRLWQWGQFEIEERQEVARSSSPFGKIADERNAAGNHGEGQRCEVIDGVACKPDGGLAAAVERRGGIILHNIRCRETREAVSWLPDGMRRIVIATYVVKNSNEPRSQYEVAALLNLDRTTVQKALATAHERIAQKLYGTFQLLPANAQQTVDETPPMA